MIIPISHLSKLFQMYTDMKVSYFADVFLKGHHFLSGDIIFPNQLFEFERQNVDSIDVIYSKSLYDTLAYDFPNEYRKPYGAFSAIELDKMLDTLKTINGQNIHKRYLHIIGDYYSIDKSSGSKVKLIAHNEPLTYEKWNVIKRRFNKNQIFYYRYSECPIIVFVDLTMMEKNDYIERFKKNTDILSILVSHSENDPLAADFIPTEDVLSVTDPDYLLDMYKKTSTRLIVIGENINESYKKALIKVKQYDKYVRMIVVPQIDHRNKDHFIRQVKLVYNSNRWDQ